MAACAALAVSMAVLPAVAQVSPPAPRFYVSPELQPADIGVGDYITKWLLPVVDIEQRGRYAAANSTLGPASADMPRVIFLGDSITDQWKNLESLRFGDTPNRVINRGISGQLSLHMLWRLQADVLAHQPKVLVLLAGTNDIRVGSNWMERPTALQLQRLMDNLTIMVDAARARGVQVVLCTLPPVHDDTFNPREFPVRSTVLRSPAIIREVNDAIRRLALERDLLLADYHTALVDTRGLMRPDASNDGLHPNERGFALMQAAVAPLVRLALSRTTAR